MMNFIKFPIVCHRHFCGAGETLPVSEVEALVVASRFTMLLNRYQGQ